MRSYVTLALGLEPSPPASAPSDACQSFLFADETVSNTIRGDAHMARGIAMTTDICRHPGDGWGFLKEAAQEGFLDSRHHSFGAVRRESLADSNNI